MQIGKPIHWTTLVEERRNRCWATKYREIWLALDRLPLGEWLPVETRDREEKEKLCSAARSRRKFHCPIRVLARGLTVYMRRYDPGETVERPGKPPILKVNPYTSRKREDV